MIKHISTSSPFEAEFGYSRAVVDGDMIYVSGTTGYDYASMRLPEDAATQAQNALNTIDKALQEAGSSLKDVVRVRYYLADVAFKDAIIPVLGQSFGRVRPAATMVVAGMIEPEMKIDIEVTARRGAASS